MSDRFMNDMACGLEAEREGDEPTLEQWRDQCRKLWAERNRLRLGLAQLAVSAPHFSDGKHEPDAAVWQRMKQYAKDILFNPDYQI